MNKIVTFLIFIVSLIVILVTSYVYYINDYLFKSRNDYFFDTEKLGQFGDFIGGFLGTILTIIATIFIYKTYISQRNELQLQRELISQQQFETTFFNMLQLHRSIKNDLSISNLDLITKPCIIGYGSPGLNGMLEFNTGKMEDFGIINGKSVFNKLIEDLNRLYEHFPHKETFYKIEKSIDNLLTDNGYGLFGNNSLTTNSNFHSSQVKNLLFKYNIFHDHHKKLLGDYFRNVYQILKFLSDKKKEFKTKKTPFNVREYSDIFQSQMSYTELALIFYNGLKFRKARKLIKEFNFVENVHRSNLLIRDVNFTSFGKIKS
jgi:hypothetical protein